MTNPSNNGNIFNLIIGTLIFTKKGRTILNENNDSLSKKERQFLLLLDAQDTVSKKMCVSMAPKINLQKMLEIGLIETTMENADFINDINTLNALLKPKQARVDAKATIASTTINKQKTKAKKKVVIANKQEQCSHQSDLLAPSPCIQVAAGLFVS